MNTSDSKSNSLEILSFVAGLTTVITMVYYFAANFLA